MSQVINEFPAPTGRGIHYLQLSSRLSRIAGYVELGSTVIDVGTDHAYIPIWLLQNGISSHAYASDNKPGPLRNAETDAERCGVRERLTLYLCDGLSLCAPESIDTIILAGMGGETIQGILDNASPWALEKRLILQPQTKFRELRQWLGERGLAVRDASLVYDTGRIYLVWLVGAGTMRGDGPVDPILVEKRDPLLKPYADEQVKRLLKQIQGMERARQTDAAELARLKAELLTLREIQKETETWLR